MIPAQEKLCWHGSRISMVRWHLISLGRQEITEQPRDGRAITDEEVTTNLTDGVNQASLNSTKELAVSRYDKVKDRRSSVGAVQDTNALIVQKMWRYQYSKW